MKKTLSGALSFVLIFQALCLQAAVESLRTPSIEPAIYSPVMLALPSLAQRERAELPIEMILQSGLPQIVPAEDSSLQAVSANFPLSLALSLLGRGNLVNYPQKTKTSQTCGRLPPLRNLKKMLRPRKAIRPLNYQLGPSSGPVKIKSSEPPTCKNRQSHRGPTLA